ncbi:MAG: hypothetical protein AVDCRST_MAG89-4232, partial [uncultured Gemmatimonadetes bacterium]
ERHAFLRRLRPFGRSRPRTHRGPHQGRRLRAFRGRQERPAHPPRPAAAPVEGGRCGALGQRGGVRSAVPAVLSAGQRVHPAADHHPAARVRHGRPGASAGPGEDGGRGRRPRHLARDDERALRPADEHAAAADQRGAADSPCRPVAADGQVAPPGRPRADDGQHHQLHVDHVHPADPPGVPGHVALHHRGAAGRDGVHLRRHHPPVPGRHPRADRPAGRRVSARRLRADDASFVRARARRDDLGHALI